ncbi:hypothetical protein PENSPDRAFT_688087 [Peniophora sp. CONT]|nr:hypothetical protein PENSPDRAFT_688087 [Peniophora sp. CONT]
MDDYPTISVPTRYSYEELEAFFDERARTKAAADFDYCCFLCRNSVELEEAHFIPIINDYRTFSACSHGLYTHELDPYDAANCLYSCRSCFYLFITTDDVLRKVVLMPCVPLMRYALHVIRHATDVASRSQTLDMIFEDLEHDKISSPHRIRAAPFLHCFQLYPRRAYPESGEPRFDSTELLVLSSPSTYIDDGEGSDATRYCILERDSKPESVQSPSRRVTFYDQEADGSVTLWRIPNRSPGALLGNADTAWVAKAANPTVFNVFDNLLFALSSRRGLPSGFVPEGGRKSWADFGRK